MKVLIKTWDEMEKEFGLDYSGDINCNQYFIVEMEENMPEDRIIEVTKDTKDTYTYKLAEGTWTISDDMIKRIIDEN